MNSLLAWTVTTIAILCAWIDFRTGLIPNALTYLTLPVLFAGALCTNSLWLSLFGCAVASGCLMALYVLTGSRGLGMGDVKLAACIGAGLGPSLSLFALGFAFVLGAVVGLMLLATHKIRRRDPIAFGPFLAAGSFVGTILGQWIEHS